jgi:hypothetical protein
MVLVNTVGNFAIPHSNTTKLTPAPIPLNEQNIPRFKPVKIHVLIRDVYLSDFT